MKSSIYSKKKYLNTTSFLCPQPSAKLIFNHVFQYFSIPEVFMSDRGTVWWDLMEILGVSVSLFSDYQCNQGFFLFQQAGMKQNSFIHKKLNQMKTTCFSVTFAWAHSETRDPNFCIKGNFQTRALCLSFFEKCLPQFPATASSLPFLHLWLRCGFVFLDAVMYTSVSVQCWTPLIAVCCSFALMLTLCLSVIYKRGESWSLEILEHWQFLFFETFDSALDFLVKYEYIFWNNIPYTLSNA